MEDSVKVNNKPAAGKPGTVARAAGVMIAATLASRVLGQLRETAIAAWFGQNATTDVYRAAFLLPDWMFFLIAGGAISAAFIPVFTQYIKDGRDEDAWTVFSTVGTFLALVVTGFVIVGEIIAPPVIPLLFKNFAPWQIDATVSLTRIILPGQVFIMLGALLMATLYVRGQFLVPSLGPIVYNLAIIAGGWLFHKRLGIAGLCWGVLAGAILGNFALQAFFARRAGVRYRPMLRLKHPGVVKVGKLVLPVIVGLSLPQVFSSINKLFAGLLEPGTMSALDNANKLMQIPLGIFGQAISIAAFPAMSMLAARGEMDGFRRTFVQATRAMWFLTVPMALLMMVAAPEIVSVILQYRKFTAQNTQVTAVALCWYCTGLFAFALQSILNRAFYALHETVAPMVIGTLATVIFVVLNLVMIRPWGYQGLAAAGSLAAVIHMVWMIAVLRKRVGLALAPLARGLMKILAASAAGALIGWVVEAAAGRWLHGLGLHAKIRDLAIIGLVMGAGGAAFLGAARALGCEEMDDVFRLLRRRRNEPNAG